MYKYSKTARCKSLFFLCNLFCFFYKNYTMQHNAIDGIENVLNLFQSIADIQSLGPTIVAESKTLVPKIENNLKPFLNAVKNEYSTDLNHFKKNIESYNIDDLLEYLIFYDKYLLNKQFLDITTECILKKIYETTKTKRIFFLYMEPYYIQSILHHRNLTDKHTMYCELTRDRYDHIIENKLKSILKIGKIAKTLYASGGVSAPMFVNKYWYLDIYNLKKYLEKEHAKNTASLSEEMLTAFSIINTNCTEKNLSALCNNTLDFSYITFLDRLFNYEKYEKNFYKLYVDQLDLEYEKDYAELNWNLKLHTAAVFIAILKPTLASNKNIDSYLSFDQEKFKSIKKIILDYTDITTLDLRFWINLFSNLETISIVGCNKLTKLSPADKLFLAGYNTYSYGNRGDLHIIIDQTQAKLIQPTTIDYILMFLQDGFGGVSTSTDIVNEMKDSLNTEQMIQEECGSSKEESWMLNLVYDRTIPFSIQYFILNMTASIFTFYTESNSTFIIQNLIGTVCFFYSWPFSPCISPAEGGQFGLNCKNELWKKYALLWLPFYFFCIIQAIQTSKVHLSLTTRSMHGTLTLLIFLLNLKKGFNYKACIRLITGQYATNQRYTVINNQDALDLPIK